jgi:hypothetical protein
MNDLQANPVIPEKFWIVEMDGEKFATLRREDDNRFVMSNKLGVKIYNNKQSLVNQFGKNFFVTRTILEAANSTPHEVHGYPSRTVPYNSMFDIKRKLPLFTKSEDSKSIYCAGYYTIKFSKGWVKSFCPKLITLQRNLYQGPFKTELEMRQALSNATT